MQSLKMGFLWDQGQKHISHRLSFLLTIKSQFVSSDHKRDAYALTRMKKYGITHHKTLKSFWWYLVVKHQSCYCYLVAHLSKWLTTPEMDWPSGMSIIFLGDLGRHLQTIGMTRKASNSFKWEASQGMCIYIYVYTYICVCVCMLAGYTC